MKEILIKKWQGHEGRVVASVNEFDVIECQQCGFKHVVALPTEVELEQAYRHEYYSKEKPLYIDRYREDLEWWNTVYTHRYEIFEQHLQVNQRTILDIGSGPGFFILNGKNRGWKVKGIEPSYEATQHSLALGLDVENIFFTDKTAPLIGHFDAINLGEVLEHIPDPTAMLNMAHKQLNTGGMICVVVPNDFNPFQMILHEQKGFDPWWVAPPHHINYFNLASLTRLVSRCGFNVVHQESTFPIDLFLLMGDNYIGHTDVGRACHS